MLTELFSGSGVHFGGGPWPALVDEVDPDVVFHFGDGSKIEAEEQAEIKSRNENEFPFGAAPLDCCVDPDSEVILPWEVDGSSFTFEEPQASTEYTPLIVEPDVGITNKT
ncbi:OLC1v1018028C1 [Oldenlandia corymbosa var. corymbosa]|uniref:OLC1v1018028C1 n=1 Tax=Oldenlandia corymbosa var. corymbosa TaxID=529605 RepID=A0AAV1EAS0_OLDCO|nr:OLC1v1018028C1 [Oldenlandia corymbosa var. corymbosa]